jgi:prefoldin subunit 5
MREILEFESWANSMLNEAGKDRPLSLDRDIQRQAQIKFPDRNPEQAMSLFVADKLANQEKLDYEQNKIINAQKRENDKLRRSLQDLSNELHDHENQAQQTDIEVARLKDLSAKLKPAGEIQQGAAKASADKVEAMLKDLENVRTNPSIDDKKFKELENKVQQMKGVADDSGIDKIQGTLSALASKQGVSDQMFNRAMNQLSATQMELQKKEKRFKKSIANNKDVQQSWGNKFAELNKEIENMKGVSEHLFTDFGQQAASMEEKISSVEKDSNEILKRFKDKLQKFDNYEEYLDNSINAIEDAKNEINHTLELVRSIGKQDDASDVISKAQSTSRHQPPQFDPELDQELSQEPEGLGPDLPLGEPDETEDIPDERTIGLREDTRISKNNYSLEEKEWLETYLPKFVYLYQKLYPNDMGTIIDEEGLYQMVEDDMHLMYQYHAVISNKVVREKFDITHRRLLNAYRNRNTEQGSLFNESLIYAYETALNNISQIRY